MTIKPVADLYLIAYEDGVPYKSTRDAREANEAIGEGFKVEEFVSLENHRAAMLHAGNHTEQHLDMVDSGWIPVSERMPNDKDFVWCYGYVSGWTESDGFEAYYDATRNKWWTVDDEKVEKITHWMPLPNPPKE